VAREGGVVENMASGALWQEALAVLLYRRREAAWCFYDTPETILLRFDHNELA
jgi:hypothetical protein